MDFEWDAAKAQSKFHKHGIRFEVAAKVFLDPDRVQVRDTRKAYGEVRWITFGRIDGRLYAVVSTTGAEPERTRIISARKANKRERTRYGDSEIQA